jgi:hypothetical protein
MIIATRELNLAPVVAIQGSTSAADVGRFHAEMTSVERSRLTSPGAAWNEITVHALVVSAIDRTTESVMTAS